MKKLTFVSLLFTLLTISVMCAQNNNNSDKDIIAKDAEIEKVETGYSFTEGSTANSKGVVYFTDQPNDKIYVWEEGKGVSLWLEGTERSNGMYFNAKDELLSCADEFNRIIVFNKNKEHKVIFEDFESKHLNGPNDLWAAPTGGIYFTDPYYHRDYWKEGHTEIQDTRGVYYISPEGSVKLVSDNYLQPNGLVGTPDGKQLYVADINDRKIWRYDIMEDGTLKNRTLFANEGSDGMTIDNKGNIYLTMGKVWVYSPEGELIKEISLPESPSNLCFGGKDRDILFITARTSVYTLKMNVRGF